jgi:hypothetical protein
MTFSAVQARVEQAGLGVREGPAPAASPWPSSRQQPEHRRPAVYVAERKKASPRPGPKSERREAVRRVSTSGRSMPTWPRSVRQRWTVEMRLLR